MANKFNKLIILFLTYFLDFQSRVKNLINPAFYSINLRINKIFQNKEENSKTIFIYVIYQKAKIPFYVKNVLDCLEKMNVVVHVVANDDSSKDSIEYLKSKSHKLILRKNIGRDFGGYKDGIILSNLESFEKLFLINDSMFYFKKNLLVFFKQLIDNELDYICLHENFQYHYHAQSFLLGFSRKIFQSKFFKDYWKFYLPFNSRLHAIHKGEVGLSSLLMKNGYTPFCLNNLSALRKKMLAQTLRNIMNILYEFNIIYDVNLKSTETLTQLALKNLNVNKRSLFNFKLFIIDSLIKIISESNPTHNSYFLFAQLFDRPCIKRDIFFRGTASLFKIHAGLESLKYSKNEISEAMNELLIKGQGSNLKLLKGLRFKLGLL